MVSFRFGIADYPTQYIDEYSEKYNDARVFEPIEDHKGNVAKAMFYF